MDGLGPQTHLEMIKNIVFCSFLGLLIAGCKTAGLIDASASAPSGNESVLIIGVKPPDHRILLFPGSIKGGAFYKNQWLKAALAGHPTDGYVVGKVKAGSIIAITMVSVQEPGSILGKGNFVPCQGAKTMVFRVPSGKVAYLGSIEYKFGYKKLDIRYTNELALAQQYTDSHFPALKGKVEHISPQFMDTTESCHTTVFIPIYR